MREHDAVRAEGPAVLRPTLAAAPAEVREAVAGLLSGPPVVELPAAAGFTASIASTVVDARGRRLFIKAAAIGDGMGEAVEAGAVLADVIGDLGPRLQGAAACGSWRVAAYEVLDGDTVSTWRSKDFPALLEVAERMRARLDPSPTPEIMPFAEAFTPLLGTWAALAAGPAPDDPDAVPVGLPVAHVRGRPLPVDVAVERLAELES